MAVRITEEQLKKFIIADAKLAALENGGVTDWTWYGNAIGDFLQQIGAESFEEYAENQLRKGKTTE